MCKRIVRFVCLVALIMFFFDFACADVLIIGSFINQENKNYSRATIEDSFTDDKVLVVLSNYESLKFKEYAPNDFSEIDCLYIRDITSSSTSLAKEKTNKLKFDQIYTTTASLIDVEMVRDIELERFNRILAITLSEPGKENVLNAIHLLEQRDDVIYVGPDFQISCSSTTSNDTYYYEQVDVAQLISLPQAWDAFNMGVTVRVGVIDTGIDITHPDLSNCVNIELSRNFTGITDPDYAPTKDLNGHGTHVAGIIAAQANNGIGVAGVCPTVELVSLKVGLGNGSCSYEAIASAIDYGKSVGIPILNISMGGTATSFLLEEAVENYSGLVVCAAGNDGENNDVYGQYPANCGSDRVIAVGASYSNSIVEDLCEFSNYGKNTVDIFAPGDSIISCYPTQLCRMGICEITTNGDHVAEGYHKLSGTSMATPYVTGVAALVLSKYPNLNASELKQRILFYADTVPSLRDYCVTGGRLNAHLSVHEHNYEYYATTSSGTHDGVCTICGETTLQIHVWELLSNTKPLYRCTICGYMASNITGLSIPVEWSEI